jgi:hypothetical protein
VSAFFLACAVLGGGILLLQLIASVTGLGHDAGHESHGVHLAEEGLHLFSVRAISTGIAFFGVGGLAGMSTPFRALLAIPLGLAFGGAAMVAIAYATRAILRLEDDGSVRAENAIGANADVYLSIPPARSGLGKIHVQVQNRLVEYQAVTSHTEPLPTGARVLVVDVVDSDTVDVVPDPITLKHEVLDVAH